MCDLTRSRKLLPAEIDFPEVSFLNSLYKVPWIGLLALEYGVQQCADALVRET